MTLIRMLENSKLKNQPMLQISKLPIVWWEFQRVLKSFVLDWHCCAYLATWLQTQEAKLLLLFTFQLCGIEKKCLTTEQNRALIEVGLRLHVHSPPPKFGLEWVGESFFCHKIIHRSAQQMLAISKGNRGHSVVSQHASFHVGRLRLKAATISS